MRGRQRRRLCWLPAVLTRTVADIVREELSRILRDYGEEPFAWQIAGRIVEARETAPIETTLQLADIVASAMPPAERRKNKNPSRRTFQALRIAVNHELDALEEGLDTIFAHLAPGGRLCVITFHSLEDRLVKQRFQSFCKGCICPPDFPQCICGRTPRGKLVNRKPIEADEKELAENNRSRSAKLRVIEKIKDAVNEGNSLTSALAEHPKLHGVMIQSKDFPGWENWAGFSAHMGFVRDHRHQVEQIALVTDSHLAGMAEFVGRHITHAEVRHFPFTEDAMAMQWLHAA